MALKPQTPDQVAFNWFIFTAAGVVAWMVAIFIFVS